MPSPVGASLLVLAAGLRGRVPDFDDAALPEELDLVRLDGFPGWRGGTRTSRFRTDPDTTPSGKPQAPACTVRATIRVLTWNLFHGRAQPPARAPLAAQFAEALARWEWDVALLQETPPWWPERLAAASGATYRHCLTSRNGLLPARRAIAARNPDLLASAGGGCNAILVRGALAILEHRERELTRTPERRVMHGVRLESAGWVVNLHGSTHPPEQRRADLLLAAATALGWAAGAPLVFGGDLNSTEPAMPGLVHVAGHHVDHVFTDGRAAAGDRELLAAGPLSDHLPLRVALEPL